MAQNLHLLDNLHTLNLCRSLRKFILAKNEIGDIGAMEFGNKMNIYTNLIIFELSNPEYFILFST